MPQIIRTLAMNWAIVLVGRMLVAMTTVSFYLSAKNESGKEAGIISIWWRYDTFRISGPWK